MTTYLVILGAVYVFGGIGLSPVLSSQDPVRKALYFSVFPFHYLLLEGLPAADRWFRKPVEENSTLDTIMQFIVAAILFILGCAILGS